MNTIIQQPYKGRWELSRDDVSIGMVNGDYAIGFTAKDPNGITLGHYFTPEEALGAVDYDADLRGIEASWAMTAWAESTFEAGAETWPEP
jgi:hypothetical protein